MTVEFYNTASEKNRLTKTLTDRTLFENVFFKERDIAIDRPYLKLTADSNIADFNYCRIVELDRYYFIDSVEIVNGGIIKAYLKTDVLMTFSDLIKNTELNIIECGSGYINADKASAEKNDSVIMSKIDIDVSELFSNDKLILVVQK